MNVGDDESPGNLAKRTYADLRRMAARRLAQLPPGQTLQATALVHEVYLRLAERGSLGRESRQRFFFAAARAMRDVLVEDANAHFYRLTAPHASVHDARAEAQADGAQLVTIDDAAEQAFLIAAFGETEELWIGLSDEDFEGAFVWHAGVPLGFTNWCAGEPSDFQSAEDHVTANFGPGGCWNDRNATSPTPLRGIVELEDLTGTVVVGDFECAVGTFLGTTPCEGWTSTNGIARVVELISPPELLFATSGDRFLQVLGSGLAADPPVSGPFPPTWPFADDTYAEARLVTPALSTTLRVDWGYRASDVVNLDFAQILVVDPATDAVLAVVAYVDKNSPGLVPAGINLVRPMTTSTAVLPPNTLGKPIQIVAMAANQGDALDPPDLFVDNVRFELEPLLPGPGDDLVQLARVVGSGGGLLPGLQALDAAAGDVFEIGYQTQLGLFLHEVPLVLASLLPTGTPPPGLPGQPGIHLDPLSFVVLVDGFASAPFTQTIVPGVNSHTFLVPPGLSGSSLFVQTFTVSTAALNGVFAASNAQEFALQ